MPAISGRCVDPTLINKAFGIEGHLMQDDDRAGTPVVVAPSRAFKNHHGSFGDSRPEPDSLGTDHKREKMHRTIRLSELARSIRLES